MNPSTDQRRGLRVVPTHGSGTGRVAHLGWVVVLVDGRDPRAMATCLDVLDRQEPSDAARLVDRLRLLLGPTPPTLCAVVPTDGGFEIAARGAVRVVGDRPSGSDELTGAADEWWTGRLDGASFVTASVGDQDAIVDDTLDLRRGIVAADAVVVLAPAMDRPGAEVAAAAPSAAGEPVGADAPADDAGSAEPAPFVAGAAAAVAAGAGPDMARDEGPDEDDQPTTISTYESDRARRLDVPDLPGGADEDDAAVEPSVGDDEPALPAPPPPFRPPGSEPAPFAPPGPGAEPAGATAASGDDDAEAPGPPGSVPSVPGMSVPSALPGPAPSMPVAGGGPRPGPDATGPDDADRMGAAPPSPAADAPPPAPAGLGGAPDLPPAPAPFEPPGHGREDDAPAPPAPAPFAPAESSPSDAEAPAEPPGPAPAPFAPPAPAAEAGAPLPAEPPAPFAPPASSRDAEAPAPPPPFAPPGPGPAAEAPAEPPGPAPAPFAPPAAEAGAPPPAEPPAPFVPPGPSEPGADEARPPTPPPFVIGDDAPPPRPADAGDPSPAPPPAGAGDEGSPAAPGPAPENVLSLIAIDTGRRRPLPIAGEEDSIVPGDEVVGVMCSRGHFNDPRSRYCGHCGIAMLQASVVPTRGPRPSLGVLVFGTGEAIPLRRDIVIGRDAASDPKVGAGAAEAVVPAGDVRTLSRIHAELRLEDWNVMLVDRNSSNGTFTRTASAPSWDRVEPGVPIELQPGLRLAFGHIVAVFESSLRQT